MDEKGNKTEVNLLRDYVNLQIDGSYVCIENSFITHKENEYTGSVDIYALATQGQGDFYNAPYYALTTNLPYEMKEITKDQFDAICNQIQNPTYAGKGKEVANDKILGRPPIITASIINGDLDSMKLTSPVEEIEKLMNRDEARDEDELIEKRIKASDRIIDDEDSSSEEMFTPKKGVFSKDRVSYYIVDDEDSSEEESSDEELIPFKKKITTSKDMEADEESSSEDEIFLIKKKRISDDSSEDISLYEAEIHDLEEGWEMINLEPVIINEEIDLELDLDNLPETSAKQRRTYTVYLHGTKSNREDNKDNHIDNFHAQTLPTNNRLLLDGVGSEPSNKESIHHSPGLFDPYSRCKEPKAGPSQIRSLLLGSGMHDNLLHSMAHIVEMIEDNGVTTINLTGFSRGAVSAIQIANELNTLYKDSQPPIEVNLFLFDPVVRPSRGKQDKSRTIPEIVKDCTIILQNDENRTYLRQPQDKSRIINESGKDINYILLPGNHATSSFKRSNPNLEPRKAYEEMIYKIGRENLIRFMVEHDTHLFDIESYDNMEPISHTELLKHYSVAKNLEASFESGYDKQKRLHVKEKRSYTAYGVNDFAIKFFINEQHRTLFKSHFPVVYHYMFEFNTLSYTTSAIALSFLEMQETDPASFTSIRTLNTPLIDELIQIAEKKNQEQHERQAPKAENAAAPKKKLPLQFNVETIEPHPEEEKVIIALQELESDNWKIADKGKVAEGHSWKLTAPNSNRSVALTHHTSNPTTIVTEHVELDTAKAMAKVLQTIYQGPIQVSISPADLDTTQKDLLWLAARQQGFEVSNHVPENDAAIFSHKENLQYLENADVKLQLF